EELGGKAPARMLAVLCVGVAYFVLGVVFPAAYLLRLPRGERPERGVTGLTFSCLAGAAGALGAICVIFATSNAVEAARAAGRPRRHRGWGGRWPTASPGRRRGCCSSPGRGCAGGPTPRASSPAAGSWAASRRRACWPSCASAWLTS